MKSLLEEIKQYTWETGQDPYYWNQLLVDVSADNLLDALHAALTIDSKGCLNTIFQFIRDLLNPFPDVPSKESFLSIFYQSNVIASLEELSTDNDYIKRSGAVFTLGKILSRESVQTLLAIFKERKDSDPLFIGGLVAEIQWLSPHNGELKDFLKSEMANSSEPFTRWAVLERIGMQGSGSESQDRGIDYQICSNLEKDNVSCIRGEAHYIKSSMDYRDKVNENKKNKKQLKKELDSKRPKVTFQEFRMTFERFMQDQNMLDYTISDLQTFFNDNYK